MKKIIILSLAVFPVLFGCKKEADIIKICPEHFTGPNCLDEIPPTKVYFKSVTITKFPGVDYAGNLFDQDGKPDIYIKVSDEPNNSYQITPTIKDASPGATYTLTFNQPLLDDGLPVFLLMAEIPGTDKIIGSFLITGYKPNTQFKTTHPIKQHDNVIDGFSESEFQW